MVLHLLACVSVLKMHYFYFYLFIWHNKICNSYGTCSLGAPLKKKKLYCNEQYTLLHHFEQQLFCQFLSSFVKKKTLFLEKAPLFYVFGCYLFCLLNPCT